MFKRNDYNMAKESVKERLISFIRFKGLSKNKFEELCGLSKRYVSNISVSIQPDKIEKISLVFPELNTGWLLSGEGEMLKEGVCLSDILTEDDRKAPLKRILYILQKEGISLREFSERVNSHEFLFENALKWPFTKSEFLLSNESQIREWVDAFCDLFPHYSKQWILLGKGDELTYVAKCIEEIKERISAIEAQQNEDTKTILWILKHLIKENA